MHVHKPVQIDPKITALLRLVLASLLCDHSHKRGVQYQDAQTPARACLFNLTHKQVLEKTSMAIAAQLAV